MRSRVFFSVQLRLGQCVHFPRPAGSGKNGVREAVGVLGKSSSAKKECSVLLYTWHTQSDSEGLRAWILLSSTSGAWGYSVFLQGIRSSREAPMTSGTKS